MKRPACGTVEGAVLWMNLDPCGIICAVVTWGLIFYAQFVANVFLLRPWLGNSAFGVFNSVCFNSIAVLSYISHFRAMMTDPGAVHNRAQAPVAELEAGAGLAEEERRNMRRWCRKCDAYKPARAHHCSICRRCIVKMDHHCPWVNNCVGVSNHKFFILFVTYVFALSLYALALVAGRFLSCMAETAASAGSQGSPNPAENGGAAGRGTAGRAHAAAGGVGQGAAAAAATRSAGDGGCGDPAANLLVVLLVLESLLFGLFTMCMMLDQWSVVASGQTQIDRLKGEHHTGTTEVNEVFGGSAKRFRWDWLLPTRVSFPADIWEDVMGYRLKPEAELEMGKYYVPVDTPSAQFTLQQPSSARGGGGAASKKDDETSALAVGAIGEAIGSGQIRVRNGTSPNSSGSNGGVSGPSGVGGGGGGGGGGGPVREETQRLLAPEPPSIAGSGGGGGGGGGSTREVMRFEV